MYTVRTGTPANFVQFYQILSRLRDNYPTLLQLITLQCLTYFNYCIKLTLRNSIGMN